MPIPFLALLGAGAAVLGVGKGIKAGVDMKDARETNEQAQSIVRNAKKDFETSKKNCNDALADYGNTKAKVLSSSMRHFSESFSKIHNIELSESNGIKELAGFKADGKFISDLKDMSDMALSMLGGVAGGAAGGLAAGAATAFGAFSATAALGTASTGTAIATLSGAAASNATLALLGGGTLAAGGLGVAGGAMVLGGLVAGPALAILGFTVGAKASAAKDDAYSNLSTAREFREEIKTMRIACKGIRMRANMFDRTLIKLDAMLCPIVYDLDCLIRDYGTDFNKYTKKQQNKVLLALKTAEAIKKILDTPILDKDGKMTEESRNIPDSAQKLLESHAV